MFELLGGGILGSVLGGVFRLAPEVLKYFYTLSLHDALPISEERL